jgi:hypothetical protein
MALFIRNFGDEGSVALSAGAVNSLAQSSILFWE